MLLMTSDLGRSFGMTYAMENRYEIWNWHESSADLVQWKLKQVSQKSIKYSEGTEGQMGQI